MMNCSLWLGFLEVEWEAQLGFGGTLNANEFGCCFLYKRKSLRNFELFHHKKYGYFVWD